MTIGLRAKVELKDTAEPAAVPPTTESEQVNDETAAVAKRAVDDAIDEAVVTRSS